MKNKRILIVVILVLLVAAALFLWKQCGAGSADPTEGKDASTDLSGADPESGETQDPDAETITDVEILENDGDLEIIIPDGLESNGF